MTRKVLGQLQLKRSQKWHKNFLAPFLSPFCYLIKEGWTQRFSEPYLMLHKYSPGSFVAKVSNSHWGKQMIVNRYLRETPSTAAWPCRGPGPFLSNRCLPLPQSILVIAMGFTGRYWYSAGREKQKPWSFQGARHQSCSKIYFWIVLVGLPIFEEGHRWFSSFPSSFPVCVQAGAAQQHFYLTPSAAVPFLYNLHICFLRSFPCSPWRVYDVGLQAEGSLVSLPSGSVRGSK